MRTSKPIALHPISVQSPGRLVLDCSGPIHREWLKEALFVRGLKVLVYRRSFCSEQMDALPVHEGLQMASGDLGVVLNRMKESINLIVDDVGAFHFNDRPLELLGSYYDALALDGEAWLRFPKTFFVFLECGKRVSLQDYLVGRFPQIVKKLRTPEMDPQFTRGASATEDWVLVRKDRTVPKLHFNIHPRTLGGTAVSREQLHAPYIEWVERPKLKSTERGFFRRFG